MRFTTVSVEIDAHDVLPDIDEKVIAEHLETRGWVCTPTEAGDEYVTPKAFQHALLAGDLNRLADLARQYVRSTGLLA
ncbi:MAG TPA: hypothetical protein VK973_05900 [Arenicellales bacterium]|nr:hypothetical protein [Arenicellales bacterium]